MPLGNDWNHTLDRAGLTLTTVPLRGQIAQAVAGVQNLADLLNMTVKRATTLRRLLLTTLAAPMARGDASAANGSAVPTAAVSANGESAARPRQW